VIIMNPQQSFNVKSPPTAERIALAGMNKGEEWPLGENVQ
jgi:hypothetical protein